MANREAAMNELALNAQEMARGTLISPVAIAPVIAKESEFDKQVTQINKLIKAEKTLGSLQDDLRVSKKNANIEDIKNSLVALEIKRIESQFTELSAKQLRDLAIVTVENSLAQEAAGEKVVDSFSSIREAAQNLADPLKGVKDQIKELNLAFAAGAVSPEVYREALAKLKEQMAEVSPMTEALQSAVSSMSQSLSNSFADMLMSGKMNMESLKDVFRGFVRTMIAKAIELFVINRILNMAFGGFGLAPLPMATLPGFRASGGSTNANQPYLVGERGPELFVPSSAGSIRNNMNTRSAGGGGAATVINQTINVSAGVAQTVRAEMISLLPRFKQDTMSAVVDAKRRGGSFGQAFG